MIYIKIPFALFFSGFTENVKNGEETAQNNNPLSSYSPNLYHMHIHLRFYKGIQCSLSVPVVLRLIY